MQRNPIYLRFPDREAALTTGAALIGEETIEHLAADGWWEGIYWCIDDIGALYEPTGEVDEDGAPVMDELPGYHVNGLWCGPLESLPEALAAYRIDPDPPLRVWG
ncbi:hypothetical protein NVS89_22415 [Ancylobacter sp. MQZ15Z-1]|uniref:Uncharacterized protein n=1 Tax=Ancylobacter mangrovi TaxID=2972472 RepID=A0A9X2PQ95_9HYPH|nr:hypothetical protein [Ancylobacter mangrovi]MCS0497848.1 hypothetical protein [Ancylobacter mangrovi]